MGRARIVSAGAVVALLDGFAAVLLYSVILRLATPLQVFQGVSRGLLGKRAADGGLPTGLLGVAMHFTVALGWAALYAVAYARWSALRRWTASTAGALAVGMAYGVVVWLSMRFLVLPLTSAGLVSARSPRFLYMVLIHMAVVGPPIALIVREQRARPRAGGPGHAPPR